MCETLEAIAQTLYKAWFIDFEPVRAKMEGRWRKGESIPGLPAETYHLFPDKLVDSELGSIPAGWEVLPLGYTCHLTMGLSPKSEHCNTSSEGLPFHQGTANFGALFPTHVRWTTTETRLAESRDIILSVRAPVGRINVALDKLVIGRGLSAIRAADGCQGFLYCQLKHVFATVDTIGGGTVFGGVTKKDLESIPLLAPNGHAVQAFERLVAPMMALAVKLSCQVMELSRIRNVLSPKLISGHAKIIDALRSRAE